MAERRLRFTAFVGVKDEADILPRSIEQLRAIGVSTIVVLDFGSTDGTLDYLAEAEAAGDIWIVPRDDVPPGGVGKRATIALARASDADFILFLDADELLLPRTGSLHDVVDTESADVLSVMRYNVVATERGPALPREIGPDTYDQLLLYAQPIPDFYRRVLREPDTPWIRGVLEPKILLRPGALVDLHAGSHDADLTADRPWRRAVATDLVIAHVPLRSRERFAIRAANYGTAIARRPEWYTGFQGWQWVRFSRAAGEGRADDEFRLQLVDREELARLRDALVVRSARDVLETPVPKVASEAVHRAMVGRAEPWLALTGLVCRAEGIPPAGKLEILDGDASTPVVFVPPGSVVKVHAHWADGHAVAEHEARTLDRLASAAVAGETPPLSVPRLVAEGTIEETYRYVVMSRVRGTPLRQLEALEGPTDRPDVPAALGRFVRWLHAVPLEPVERTAAWPAFVTRVAALRDRAVELNRERGMPEHLLAELDGWLPSVDELAGPIAAGVLVHGALDDSNVLGWIDERRFVPTAIIDFARAFVGNPIAELGAIWWGALRADRVAAEVCMREAGSLRPEADDAAALTLAWVLITPGGGPLEPTTLGEASSLTDLAHRWFGWRVPERPLLTGRP